MISIEERKDRINSTTHVVRMEDSSIYRVSGIEELEGGMLFVTTDSDLIFQDLDVMTLEEAAKTERLFDKIKQILTL